MKLYKDYITIWDRKKNIFLFEDHMTLQRSLFLLVSVTSGSNIHHKMNEDWDEILSYYETLEEYFKM